MTKKLLALAAGVAALLSSDSVSTPRFMENLGRGVVAVRTGDAAAYVGWRLLGTDPADIAFNLYRTTGASAPLKLNDAPLTATTDFVDTSVDPTQPNSYAVRPLLAGVELTASAPFTLPANAPIQQYLTVPIQRPAGGNVEVPPDSPTSSFTYNANDASVADLDGDGEYEIVLKWDPSNSRDSASAGLSGHQILDAYKLDGTRLWRIDLGRNIRAGAHDTQFMVYDLDGDGKAEVVCKTADGTIDGLGHTIGDAGKDYRSLIVPTDGIQVPTTSDARYGKVLAGPEYLTLFDGLTGAALATVPYAVPRDPLNGWGGIGGNGNNDSNGNRANRFLAAVAYLDGRLPSVVMARGYYGRTVLAAWDWRNGSFRQRWVFDSGSSFGPFPYPDASPFSGMGNHNLSVADVDGDGRDEIIYGSMVVDDDGTGLFSTGLRHGDALHVSDLDPGRPGLEVFGVHENEGQTVSLGTPGMAMYDARTGEIQWQQLPGIDVGRGLAADIDPRHAGYEFWGLASAGLLDVHGQSIGTAPSSVNFAVWWDADLLREILDDNWISKWDWTSGTLVRLLTAGGAISNNGTKATPALSADILGDWREEVIWRAADNNSLRIYTTTIPATNRLYTLMHDPQYRLAIAWQNVGYNQPPHPGFFLGDGMSPPPRPAITHLDTLPPAFKTLTPSATTLWPPNHRMVSISIDAEAVDLIDPAPHARIVGVSSNEPIDGPADGHTAPDWEITGALTVNLRAERAGSGSGRLRAEGATASHAEARMPVEGAEAGRVYTIIVEARDASGNTTRQRVTVSVPLFR
jgi:rhamnogalacturonan endolyase